MQIQVNGTPLEVADAVPLSDALETLGYAADKVVVAVNECFVARATWGEHVLAPNDRLDVLAPNAGG